MTKLQKFMLLATTLAASSAQALSLSPGGVGQVLTFPYYTANADQGTLITLTNSSTQVKALKVRFHEAYNGRTVGEFNLYLSPLDVWTGEIIADGTGTTLATRDTSCTVPAFPGTIAGSGVMTMPFSSDAFTAAQSDGGPVDASRLREGHFDVIEMGEITGDTFGFRLAATHDNGVPRDCAALAVAWAAGGEWSADPTADLTPPAGGVYGSSAIIDVGQGTFFVVQPAVLDGFSSAVQHTAPTSASPDLNSATASGDTGTLVSIDVGGRTVNARYAHSVDAVSALFMNATHLNEYVIEPGAGAKTDWVVTFPTKRFYVDPAIVGSSANFAPFDAAFGSGGSCSVYGLQLFNREELTLTPTGGFFGSGSDVSGFCHETSVVALAQDGSSALHSALKEQNGVPLIPTFTEGHAIVDMTENASGAPRQLAASNEGYVLSGLPGIGFVAESYVNANVTAGVLANYSGVFPHHSTVHCGMGSGATQPCQ